MKRRGSRAALVAALAVMSSVALAAPVAPHSKGKVHAGPATHHPAPPAPPLSPADALAQAQRDAIHRAETGDLAGARALVAGHSDAVFDRYLVWLNLTRGRGPASFDDAAQFLDQHPDWPLQGALRRRAEELLVVEAGPITLLDWFAKHPPVSREGRLKMVDALRQSGRGPEADALLRQIWTDENFTAAEELLFAAQFADALTPDVQNARLDRLLWRRDVEAARRQLARVDDQHRAIAETRIRFIEAAPASADAEALAAALPPALAADPGVAYDRVRFRTRSNDDKETQALLLAAPAGGPHPELWWEWREIEARRALADGDAQTAYKLAAAHGLTSGTEQTDAEFLAGWIALRKLDDPARAARHFAALVAAGKTPITLGRGWYWAGRTAEQAGDQATARTDYGRAAQYVTTFYGQAAAARLGLGAAIGLPADPAPTPAERAAFEKHDAPLLVHKLIALGERPRVEPFLRQLGEAATTPTGMALAAAFAGQMGRIDIGVSIARRAATRDGITLVNAGYPVLPAVSLAATSVEPALIYGVIRQESNFGAEAVSRVGARGLMQLMPATARTIAQKLKLPYSLDRLTSDPAYNLLLGHAYLGQVIDSFSGSYVMALAGYNAGPGRVRAWSANFGDPRDANVDVIDWIEQIPFTETRNYVQRVLEVAQIYHLRLATLPAGTAFASGTPGGLGWCLLACATPLPAVQPDAPRMVPIAADPAALAPTQ